MNIKQIANRYQKAHGLEPISFEDKPVDLRLSLAIAEHYDNTTEAHPMLRSYRTYEAYKAFNAEIAKQYWELTDAGLILRESGEAETYSTLDALKADIERGYVYVDINNVPEHGLMNIQENIRFRFVHDIFGHALHNATGGHYGEEKAYHGHKQMFSPLAQLALATETRGQNCALHFGRVCNNPAWLIFDERFDANGYAVKFPEQKAFILPEQFR